MSLPATPRALDAARRIRAVHDLIRQAARLAEAQVMESCWEIRGEIPDRDAFEAFCAAELPMLEPGRAWLMAETWGAARRSRRLRDAARSDPDAALEFVRGFVEAGLEGRLLESGVDAEAVEVLTLPPRRRGERMRKLLDVARQVEAGRDPVAEEIERAVRERDEAVAALKAGSGVESLAAHPQRRLREAAGELQAAEAAVAELAGRIEGLCAAERVPDAMNRRLVAAGDLLIGNVERIITAAMGGRDAQ